MHSSRELKKRCFDNRMSSSRDFLSSFVCPRQSRMCARKVLFTLSIFILCAPELNGYSGVLANTDVTSAFHKQNSGHDLDKREANTRTSLDSPDFQRTNPNDDFGDVDDLYNKDSDVRDNLNEKDVLRNFYNNLHTVDFALARLEQALAEQSGDGHVGSTGENSSDLSDSILGEDDGENADFEKRPAFSSWSGKRAAFSPWSGKRADLSPRSEKRPSFAAWSGKRASFSPWSGKRAAFAPWSGKRAAFSAWSGKREAFAPWSGKRDNGGVRELDDGEGNVKDDHHGFVSEPANKYFKVDPGQFDESTTNDESPQLDFDIGSQGVESSLDSGILDKRPSFSPWRGKRNDGNVPWKSDVEKRPSFSAWSGKRSNDDNLGDRVHNNFGSMLHNHNSYDKRPSFSPWRGKRGDVSSSGEIVEKKPSFSAWSGKRSDNLDPILVDDFSKRPAFSPWLGKRDDGQQKRPAFSAWSGRRKRGFVKSNEIISNDDGSELYNGNIWDISNSKPISDNINQPKRANVPGLLRMSHGRAHLLTALASLYNRLVNRRRNPSMGLSENVVDNFSTPIVVQPNDGGMAAQPDKLSSLISQRKRPAFSAWSGRRRRRKRDVSDLSEEHAENTFDLKDSEVESDLSNAETNVNFIDSPDENVSFDDIIAPVTSDSKEPLNLGVIVDSIPKEKSDIKLDYPSFKLFSSMEKDHSTIRDKDLEDSENYLMSAENSDNQRPFHSVHEKRKAETVEEGTKSDRPTDSNQAVNTRSQYTVSEDKNPDPFADLSLEKRPSFSPWSGKRGMKSKLFTEKRPSFSPWSGKRDSINGISSDKRPSFSAWSGKRASRDNDILSDKRAAFSPWSEKRGDFSASVFSEKRPSFSAWSGKRGSHSVGIPSMKRAAFSAWSGKRNSLNEKRPQENLPALAILPGGWGPYDEELTSGKRQAFAPWSGKRSSLSNDSPAEKRPAFSPWLGKRYFFILEPVSAKRPSFAPWSGKRSSADFPLNKRPSFHPWLGKRSTDMFDVPSLDKRPSFSPWSGKRITDDPSVEKRPAFSAWYGKRSDDNSLIEKRPSFQPWSGKRATISNNISPEKHLSMSTLAHETDSPKDSNSKSEPISENSSLNLLDIWPIDFNSAPYSEWTESDSVGTENLSSVENKQSLLENQLQNFKHISSSKDTKDISIIQNNSKANTVL